MPAPMECTASIGSLATAASRLQRELSLERAEERRRRVRFLDTLDWRVHRAGYRLAATDSVLELTALDTGAVVLTAEGPPGTGDRPGLFAADLPAPLRARLADPLGVRALLAVATVEVSDVVLVARNADQKIVARLMVSASIPDGRVRPARGSPLRLRVVPLRGYAKDGRRLADRLAEVPGVRLAESTLFEDAVRAQGRAVGDYTGKLALDLDPHQPAGEAARVLYRELLATMRANEEGVCAQWDSEFLHDFRVAVRRTRSALKELPAVLPASAQLRFRAEFKWLGDITTPTRDLDVYLLTFEDFTAAVGDAGPALAPLHDLLVRRQRRAAGALARALRSRRYAALVADWADLHADPPTEQGADSAVPIGELADVRIRKVARRVLRMGAAIDPGSPAEALHDLRKRAKELRYLLEFFGDFYDGPAVSGLLSALKGLQDNLGRFQDSTVQHRAIEDFAEQLVTEGQAPAATLLALGRLGTVLDERGQGARAEFADRFAAFAEPANTRRLHALRGAAA